MQQHGGTQRFHSKWSKSEKKRQIQYITYMWNLKYDTNELIDKTETDLQDTDKELTVTRGKKAWCRHELGVWDQQIQKYYV